MSEVSDRIEVRGLRALGRCGALPEERDRPQPLEVDLDVALDLTQAAASDDLADTVDYGGLCALVERLVQVGHVALLERRAEDIAEAVLAADERITEVTVGLRKVRPPVPSHLGSAGVRITRKRSE